MFSSTNNNVNFAKCRKINLVDIESDIEEYVQNYILNLNYLTFKLLKHYTIPV